MENQMLVEFRVKNFRSFRDEQVLSFVASNDTVLEGNCATESKLRLLKAVGIYGPNASGKSNLIKAIDIMRGIVLNSANYKPGKKLPVQPFLLDDESQAKPSFFEVTFFHEGIRYQYGFTATDERIHEEWLLAYPKGQPQRWYERNFNKLSTLWSFGPSLKGEKAKISDKTRDNALFLSVAAQWNNKQLTTVYEWFKDKLRTINYSYELQPVTARMLLSSKDDEVVKKKMRSSITTLMQSADLGICDIIVEKSERDTTQLKFPLDMPNEVKEQFMQKFKYELLVKMAHRNTKTGKKCFLPLEEESKGTQCFFNLLGPWAQAISHGITIFIDELDASLHPLLVRELIEVIHNTEITKSGVQLIFATHDTTLLDPELFRRDQIWFTEKDKGGGTQLYSMSDYKERKPRKGEAMQKGYLSGRYGAIPIIKAFELNG